MISSSKRYRNNSPSPVFVGISPFAVTQDTVLQFSSIYSQAVAVAAQQAAIRLFKGVLIIGLTRAADLITEEAAEFTPINIEYIFKMKNELSLSLPKVMNMLITELRNR